MSWTAERARVAALTRSRSADDPELLAARRNLRAEHLAEYVRRVVSEAPPLTDEQLAAVCALLRGGVDPTEYEPDDSDLLGDEATR